MARVIPHNLEAEMSVLGVAFLAKDQVDKICESVDEDMFYELDAELLIMLARLYPSHNLRLLEKFVQENYREFKT